MPPRLGGTPEIIDQLTVSITLFSQYSSNTNNIMQYRCLPADTKI